MPLSIEPVTVLTPDARMLITELEAELSTTYSAEQRHGLNVDRIFHSNVSFFIAHLEGDAVGCGAIAVSDGSTEVKRMYVRPEARRQGIARAILDRLELEARARGVSLLVLETGDAQHAAIRLYERAGFTRRAPFGEYADMPSAAIRRSVFFEKHLEKDRVQIAGSVNERGAARKQAGLRRRPRPQKSLIENLLLCCTTLFSPSA